VCATNERKGEIKRERERERTVSVHEINRYLRERNPALAYASAAQHAFANYSLSGE